VKQNIFSHMSAHVKRNWN